MNIDPRIIFVLLFSAKCHRCKVRLSVLEFNSNGNCKLCERKRQKAIYRNKCDAQRHLPKPERRPRDLFDERQLELFMDEIRLRREAGEMITRKRISEIAQEVLLRAA